MNPIFSLRLRHVFMLFAVMGLLMACTAASVDDAVQAVATSMPATLPAAIAEPTAEPTVVPEPEIIQPVGLIYRTEGGLWQVDADGQSQFINANQDGYPSPDQSRVAAWDSEDTITVIDLTTSSEQHFSPENGRLGGFFGWADPQTLLVGIWLTPEEGDGPNDGHLAVMDISNGQFVILDNEGLMSSPPAVEPQGEMIAYTTFAGPMFYRFDTGPQPFKLEGYTGLGDFAPAMFNSPAWSPDSLKLAWLVSGPNPTAADGIWQTNLLIADLAHQTAQLLHSFDPAAMGGYPPAAVWSPDGQWLALRVNGADEEQSGLWLIAADGSVEWKLDGNNLADVAWLADGRSLVHAIFDKDGRTSFGLYDTLRQIDFSLDLPPGLPVAITGNVQRVKSFAPISRGICPDIPRPALITYGSDLKGLALHSLDGINACQLDLPVEPLFSGSNVQALNGSVYFVGTNTDTLGYTVWRLGPDGTSQSLPFTSVPGGPTYFTISADGRAIAWSYTDGSQNQYKNSLWIADIETGQTMTLLTDVTDEGDLRVLQPIRFSADNSTLFYSFQPNGLGGQWSSFNGRYDNLYRIAADGGESVQLVANCFLCIGDVAPDGGSFAYVDSKDQTVKVMDMDGQLITTITPPATDYLGFPSYSLAGQLAFVSATLATDEPNYGAYANPGYITVVSNPGVTAEPGNILSEIGVSTLWQWIDENHIAYNYYNSDGSDTFVSGLGIAGLDSRDQRLPDLFPLAVLR